MAFDFDKRDVMHSWLQTPVKRRKEYLTFTDSSLCQAINLINANLCIKAQEDANHSYELLECLETVWTEPMYMQVKESYVKGMKLVKLLDATYPEFLQGQKRLLKDDVIKIFNAKAETSWRDFEVMVCKLLEQVFLTCHYESLEILSSKVAASLLNLAPKRRQTKPKPAFIFDNLIIDFSEAPTQANTDADEETVFMGDDVSGSHGYRLRKQYSHKEIVEDDDMDDMRRVACQDWYNPLDLENLAVVRDYYATVEYVMPWHYYMPRV
mmetsp:Transcript_26201/g.46761  ORF Transcript_26201/g.46761 Transcript_26201/m.46761 type:complete len:267 (-) Transcript_26201:40-840(-)